MNLLHQFSNYISTQPLHCYLSLRQESIIPVVNNVLDFCEHESFARNDEAMTDKRVDDSMKSLQINF
jgi:hypothetical protein